MRLLTLIVGMLLFATSMANAQGLDARDLAHAMGTGKTKGDKLKRGPAQATLLKIRKTLPPLASAQVFSSKNKAGLTELINRLNEWYEITPKV